VDVGNDVSDLFKVYGGTCEQLLGRARIRQNGTERLIDFVSNGCSKFPG